MGIPSYFHHILKKYPSLIKGAGLTNPCITNILLVDFNCLIYGCMKSPNLPIYTHENERVWEDALLYEIKSYVVSLWRVAGTPATVFLAVDGVVPMAKIRQQRLRRFKSVWLAKKERELGVRAEQTWDSNTITPGTYFMERLSITLKELCNARAGWSVSGAEFPGEGEQKLMEWVRTQPTERLKNKNITVYGLDADLILLSSLHAAQNPCTVWSILRESQEFGKGASKDAFTTLSIHALLEIMFPQKDRLRIIIDYIAGMTLLGNDFLPHSLAFTIRNSGHDRLLKSLMNLHKKGEFLVDESQTIIKANLEQILAMIHSTEEDDIESAFKKKYRTKQTPRSDRERAMLPVENLPIEWAEERTLCNLKTFELYEDWSDRYYDYDGKQDIHQKCVSYFSGLQWVLNYYTGKDVSTDWMYAWTYPPLWKDLYATSIARESLPPAEGPSTKRLAPQQQLAMVLPYESWSLVRSPPLKTLPARLPAFCHPFQRFHSLGKRWLWECSPDIPILTPARIFKELE
jgi:5'-3' exonuclease